jgi:hypothetical protein
MPQHAGYAPGLDPYAHFTLRLREGNRTYSGSKRTGLFPPPGVVPPPPGGDPSSPRKISGMNKNTDITLKRGVIQDTGLSAWASQSTGQNKYGTIPLERGVTQDSGFGAWANQSAGQNKYGTIPLERGVTHDSGFSTWASQVWDFGSAHGSEPSPANSPKNIFLEILNEAGQVVVRYRIHGLSVSETPVHPPAGVLHHFLQPHGTRSIQDQLAVIFQNSLKRYRP